MEVVGMCTGSVVGRQVAGSVAVQVAGQVGGALVAILEGAGGAVQEAWQAAWQYVRASRIGGCTVLGDGALEYAEAVAVAIYGEAESDEAWALCVAVLDAMGSLL